MATCPSGTSSPTCVIGLVGMPSVHGGCRRLMHAQLQALQKLVTNELPCPSFVAGGADRSGAVPARRHPAAGLGRGAASVQGPAQQQAQQAQEPAQRQLQQAQQHQGARQPVQQRQGRSDTAGGQAAHGLSAAGAAALRRQMEQQQQQQQAAPMLATPGGEARAAAGQRARLTGAKRTASGEELAGRGSRRGCLHGWWELRRSIISFAMCIPSSAVLLAGVIDLLDSDEEYERDYGRPGPAPAYRRTGGSHDGAGPSRQPARQQQAPPPPVPRTPLQQQQRWAQQARQLAGMLQVPQHLALEALEQHGGDVQLAAELLLDGAAAQDAATRSPVAAAQPAGAGARAGPAAGAAAGRRAAEAPQVHAGVLGGGAWAPAAAWAPQQRLPLPPLPAGQSFGAAYEVVLLLDRRERQRAQRDLSFLLGALHQRGVAVEQRHLPVGDALWVARPRCAAL